MTTVWRAGVVALGFVLMPGGVWAQTASVTGSVAAMIDHLPNAPAGAATELRLRTIVDAVADPKPWLRVRLVGAADGRVGERNGSSTAGALEAREAWVEIAGARGDVRVGAGRLTWGRLDEVQPTDVINPIDVATFLLEGRSEARLPVTFVRARVFAGEALRVEALVVPVFRRGRFDRLDEHASPFNLLADLPSPSCPPGVPCPDWTFDRDTPAAGRLQGGARLGVTTGRVDWSIAAWRGFEPFELVTGVSAPTALRLEHPRFTMIGGDVETVIGRWALRAEGAYFPSRTLQVTGEPATFESDVFEAGAGVDRRAGDFTLSGTVLVRLEEAATRVAPDLLVVESTADVSIVGGFSRTFNRDRIETRVFTLLNPVDRASFLRAVLTWKPVDDLHVETSAGWFAGQGDDVITRFADRDFGYVRVKYFFGS